MDAPRLMGPLHIVEYEGPFMREDGWQHLRGGVKVREATVPEVVAWLREQGAVTDVWYWVTPVDNPDALGDYGGFMFQTYDEAEKFVEAEYAEHERLRREGYYEEHSTPDLLQIETVKTVAVDVVDAALSEKPRKEEAT